MKIRGEGVSKKVGVRRGTKRHKRLETMARGGQRGTMVYRRTAGSPGWQERHTCNS